MALWTIDPAHSEVKFKVKHLVVSTVTGQFDAFRATVRSEKPDFSDAQIAFEADVASINTKNAQRDGHLKSADFFDAAAYPTVSFVSRSAKRVSGSEFRVTGDLTMRGVTKEVVLDVTYGGTVAGFGGGQVAAFEIQGKVNRFDFGLQWNGLTEAGGVVVSSDVKLEIFAELNQAQSEAAAA